MASHIKNMALWYQLANFIGVGSYKLGAFRGYLHIEISTERIIGEPSSERIMLHWTTHKYHHDAYQGPSVSMYVHANGVGNVYKSALTMHQVTDIEESNQIIADLGKMLLRAAYLNRDKVSV